MDRTGSGLRQMAECGNSSTEPSDYAIRSLLQFYSVTLYLVMWSLKPSFITYFHNHVVTKTFSITSLTMWLIKTLPSPFVLNMGLLKHFYHLFSCPHHFPTILFIAPFHQPCGLSLWDSTQLLCFILSCLHLPVAAHCQIYIRTFKSPLQTSTLLQCLPKH